MGGAASTGPAGRVVTRKLFDPANAFQASRHLDKAEAPGGDALAAYCILGGQPAIFSAAATALRELRAPTKPAADAAEEQERRALDRSMGCLLGNAVGDALGAPLEFSPVQYGVQELYGLSQVDIWKEPGYNSFGLEPGQWTDDASMGLCIADSLLCCNGFDAIDLRQRFYLWYKHGYNNAFGRDASRQGRSSVGLGGNISMSMNEWEREPTRAPRTGAGNQYTSGNGSVMRNGAMPVWYRNDLEAGMAASYEQSKTTHGGEEAAELCRLLTFVCGRFINGAGRELLDDLSSFQTPHYNVRCLADAVGEERHKQNSDPIFGGLENRQWTWREPQFRYCEQRATEQPGYIGSYAMDAMAMALHCVYSTKSFEEATLKAANLRGDSDSVCAVVGQLAGALYGSSAIPPDWLDHVQRWDGGSIAARALLLYKGQPVSPEEALSDQACDSAALLGTAVAAADDDAQPTS